VAVTVGLPSSLGFRVMLRLIYRPGEVEKAVQCALEVRFELVVHVPITDEILVQSGYRHIECVNALV
jgi:hypothetical protein